MILQARFVVPMDGPVIADGAVVIEDGLIRAVGPAQDYHSPPVTDYGHAVLCPGFVNSHTHLELTSLAGRAEPTPDFIGWLGRLVNMRQAVCSTREGVIEAVRQGVAQSLRAGVTMIGDITSTPSWTRDVLMGSPLAGVSFGEVIAIGRRRHLLTQQLQAATTQPTGSRSDGSETRPDLPVRRTQTGRMRIGLSPHAPYTVEPDAMRVCAERARGINAPLCMHVAETADEEEFTRSRAGPFAAYLRDMGVWDEAIRAGDCGPVELAARTGILGPRTIAAHANYVSDRDLQRLASSGTSVAYCPRTHHAFGHAPHRFSDMLAAGINVCVGTDSAASNPSLSLLDELRFLRATFPALSPDEILAMGTIRGARALGLADEAGSLTVGKAADLVVIPLREQTRLKKQTRRGQWYDILESSTPPVAVYVSGEPVRMANEK